MRAYSITSAPRTWARCAVSGAAARADPERGLGSGARLRWLLRRRSAHCPRLRPALIRGAGARRAMLSAPDRSAPRTRAPRCGDLRKTRHFCASGAPTPFAQKRHFAQFAPGGGARRGAPRCCTAWGDARALHGLRTAPLEHVGQGRSSAHSAPALPKLCRWVFFPLDKVMRATRAPLVASARIQHAATAPAGIRHPERRAGSSWTACALSRRAAQESPR